MLPSNLTPSAIVAHLNEYVIGQDEAKRTLAVAVYTHYRRLSMSGPEVMEKSNVLLVGPSGSGKTLLCRTLADFLTVPFVTADATSLAQSQYPGEEIAAILQRLLEKADGDALRAGHGIVFIDEIDKLKATPQSPEGYSQAAGAGERVQHALLKITEGSTVLVGATPVDTTGILFICGGAFVGIEHIMARTHSFGFISTEEGSDQSVLDRLNNHIKPTDLLEYGLIPEFTGRLPVVARLNALTKAMLVQVMVEPKNSLFNQFSALLKHEGVELTIQTRVYEEIAEIAYEYKTGARSLRGIFEELFTPVLYVLPDHPEIKKVEFRSLFEKPRLFQ